MEKHICDRCVGDESVQGHVMCISLCMALVYRICQGPQYCLFVCWVGCYMHE